MEKRLNVNAFFVVYAITPAGAVEFYLYPELKADLFHIALYGPVSYLKTMLVKEGTPGASVVAVRTTDSTSFYSMNTKQLAENLGLSRYQALTAVDYLGLKENPDCHKVFKMGAARHMHYSPKALDAIRKALETESIEEIVAKVKRSKTGADIS